MTINSRRRFLLAAGLLLLAAGAAVVVLALQGAPAQAKLSRSAKLSAAPNGQLKFSTKKITVAHGAVTLTMTNPRNAGIPHAISIEGKGVDKDGKTARPGGISKVSAKLKKGTYTFYCPIPGHEAGGMKGKLVVK